MQRITTLAAVAVLGASAVSSPSNAQWVSFNDETNARLDLSVADMNDDTEKNIAVGDLNQNGSMDIIVVRKVPFSTPGARTDVILMNEDGVLVDRTAEFAPGFLDTATDARFIIMEDMTGDGWLDVIIANTFDQQPSFYRNLGNDSNGNWQGLTDESSMRFPFIAPANQPNGPKFCGVDAGDVTGNGAPDLYFSNYQGGGSGTTDVLLINDGDGFFTDQTEQRLGNRANVAFGTGAQIVDMNNNGHMDIIKISTLFSVQPWGTTGVFTLYNDGTGRFDNLPYQTLETSVPYMFQAADLTNNGIRDVFVVRDTQDRVLLAQSINSDGTVNYVSHTISPSPRTSGFGGDIAIGDIDNNGFLDVGVSPVDVDIANCSGGAAGEFALLQNPGNGEVFDPWPNNDDQNIHVRPHDMKFIDINNNGCLDIFMGLCAGWRVFMQTDCDPPQPPVNDHCQDAIVVEDGTAEFTNINATTTGPAEPDACTFDGDDDIQSDVWFEYTATCSGEVTISLCDGNQPPAENECAGNCGGEAPSGCWCDDQCDDFGDCCPDICDDCPDLTHCQATAGECDGNCGGQAPSGCWCDDQCDGFGDCCPEVCNDCPNLSFCPSQATGQRSAASGFDTKLAVYGSDCPTSSGSVIACNKDACGSLSEVTIDAQAGEMFKIRIGGHNGATGEGVLNITCDPSDDCPGDFNNDGVVDGADLLILLSAWGTPDGDLTGDGNTDGADLLVLLSTWGPCP